MGGARQAIAQYPAPQRAKPIKHRQIAPSRHLPGKSTRRMGGARQAKAKNPAPPRAKPIRHRRIASYIPGTKHPESRHRPAKARRTGQRGKPKPKAHGPECLSPMSPNACRPRPRTPVAHVPEHLSPMSPNTCHPCSRTRVTHVPEHESPMSPNTSLPVPAPNIRAKPKPPHPPHPQPDSCCGQFQLELPARETGTD
ncbi:hypothetical protein M2361_005510 [Achromobacter sp. JUb104]|nr:hypothetical protein [Achromobacter sp. JUb104]